MSVDQVIEALWLAVRELEHAAEVMEYDDWDAKSAAQVCREALASLTSEAPAGPAAGVEEIGPRPVDLTTCKGCPAFRSKRWREPSGDGETYDSGTSTDCAAFNPPRNITAYGGTSDIPPDWCPALAPVPAGEAPPTQAEAARSEGEAVAWISKTALARLMSGDKGAEWAWGEPSKDFRVPLYTAPPPQPVGEPSGEDVERAARAIAAEAHGVDPDDAAPLSAICGPNNEPLPWWRYYEEDARAALSSQPSPTQESEG